MDIVTLRVFDSLKKIGLSEAEYKELEEEQKAEEHTGIYIQCQKKGYCICVSHDEKHQIIIKHIKQEVKDRSRCLFKTLVNIKDLPEEVYVLHAIAQYRAMDFSIKFTANTLDELKDRICDRFLDGYPKTLGSMWDDVYADNDDREKNKKRRPELVEKQLKSLHWLFGQEYKQLDNDVRNNIPRIIKVFERNNRRLAVFQEHEATDRKRGGAFCCHYDEHIERTIYMIKCYTPKSKQYDYVDVNREIFLGGYDTDYTELWLNDDMFGKTSSGELRLIANQRKGFVLLTADSYNKEKAGMQSQMISAQRAEMEEQARKKLVNKIESEFKKGKVVRHGIEFTKKSFEYEGIKIEGPKMEEYLEYNNIVKLETPIFIDIFKGYVNYLMAPNMRYNNTYHRYGEKIEYNFEGNIDVIINKVKLKLLKRGNNFYINAFKIRMADSVEVIRRAINYNSQEEYDKYVQYCGRVNLSVQKALETGVLDFDLKADSTSDNDMCRNTITIRLSIPISREDKKYWTTILGKRYRIKDINTLLKLGDDIDSSRIGMSGGGYLQRIIRILYKSVENITPKEIGDIINDGERQYLIVEAKRLKELKAKVDRSKEFIKNAVKITKAVRKEKGYIVKGISGMNYYVDDECKVYSINKETGKTDKYICIVDEDSNWDNEEWQINDRIAKRLLMLSKDLKVADEVHTIKERLESPFEYDDIEEDEVIEI